MLNWIFKIFKAKPTQQEKTQTNEEPEYFYFKKLSENYFEPKLVVATRTSDAAITEEMERQEIFRKGGAIRYGNLIDMKSDLDLIKNIYK